MPGLTAPATGFAAVELARVEEVDLVGWTVTVTCVFSQRVNLPKIPLLTTYCHPAHGGGVSFMPEVGSYCYLCFPAEQTPFILGFIENPRQVAPQTTGPGGLVEQTGTTELSAAGERDPLEPGDLRLATADGNQVTLRRGGLVQIGATGLCQRLYIPIENVVRDYFQRYQARSPLGEIDWGHATVVQSSGLDTTQETPVLVRYSIKETAQEDVSKKNYTVELRVGRLDSNMLDTETDNEHLFASDEVRRVPWSKITAGQKGVISLTVYSHESDKVTYAFQVSRDGNGFMRLLGNLQLDIDGDLAINVKKGAEVRFGSKSVVELTESDEFKAAVTEVVLDAVSKLRMNSTSAELTLQGSRLSLTPASVTLEGGAIFLGDNATDPVVTVQGLLAFWNAQIPKQVANKLVLAPATPVDGALAGSLSVFAKK